MPLPFLVQISGEEIVRALNWTLIHSLWQGMLLSVLAGSIVFFTKKASPSLRYNLLTGSLLAFIIVVAVTFIMQLQKIEQVTNTALAVPNVPMVTNEQGISQLDIEGRLSATNKAVAFFNGNANWIVFTWLFIIGLQFIRLTAGIYGVYQLKRRQIFSPGEYWNNRMTELSRQLQINKQVKLLQSGIAKMPAVVGYFKPVILFPAGLLASLPVNEVEAILIHELAHIHRKDFLVNMLQNMIEIIFFFNPAVLWVSSLIKSERENCCDDIAVSQTDNKQNYIKALLSFEAFNLPTASPLANAFSGEKNHLMNRIKRIIYNNNKTLNNMEKKFLAAGMIITSIFIFAFSSGNVQQKMAATNTLLKNTAITVTDNSMHSSTPISDTVPSGNKKQSEQSVQTVEGDRYKIVTKDGEVTELYENGKKIPSEKIADYKNVTNEILKQYKSDAEQSDKEWEEAALGMQQSKKDMEQYKLALEQARIEMEQSQKEMGKIIEKAKMEIEESKRDMVKANIDKEMKIEMEQYQDEIAKEMEKVKMEIELSKKDMNEAKIGKEMKEEMRKYQEDRKREMKQAKIEMEQYQKQMMQAKIEMEQSKIQMAQAKKDMEQSKILQEKIIGDFIKENIIKDKNELASYTLNNKELIVNGIKQPHTIFKKFKDKYVKSNSWSISYNNNDDVK